MSLNNFKSPTNSYSSNTVFHSRRQSKLYREKQSKSVKCTRAGTYSELQSVWSEFESDDFLKKSGDELDEEYDEGKEFGIPERVDEPVLPGESEKRNNFESHDPIDEELIDGREASGGGGGGGGGENGPKWKGIDSREMDSEDDFRSSHRNNASETMTAEEELENERKEAK